VVGERNQYGKDHDMNQPLEELSVVHGAHAGNQPSTAAAGGLGAARSGKR
jgi:hypothetical protein